MVGTEYDMCEKCGGAYRIKLVCEKCGFMADHEIRLTYSELLADNLLLKEHVRELENKVSGYHQSHYG